jgi:hypothetical protein
MEEEVGPASMTMGNEVMEDEPIDLDGEFGWGDGPSM